MGLLTIVRVHVNCQIAILLMSMLPGGIMFGFFRWTEDGGFRDLLKFFMFVMFMAGQAFSFWIAGKVLDKMEESDGKKEVLIWR